MILIIRTDMKNKIQKTYERQENISKSFKLVAVATAAVVFVFLIVLYTLGDGILRNNAKRETLSEMKTLEENIFQSSTSTREFMKYLYSKNTLKSIIEDDTENMEKISLSINKAYTEISIMMPYIHSIEFYNGITDKMFYTGRGSLADEGREKRAIKELKNSSSSFDSRLRSVNIHKGNSNAGQNVISYFMYSEAENGSFIVFNMDISLIYDSIKTNAFSGISLLLDKDGTIVGKNTTVEDNRQIEAIIEKHKDALLNGYGSITGKINGERYLIICKELEKSDMTVFRAYPLKELYSMINQFRIYVIIIGALFELIILILNIFVTNKVYEPILEFVNTVHSQIGGKEELASTKNIVRNYKYQLEVETQESELWHAVSNSKENDREQTEAILRKYNIDLSVSKVVPVVLEIENYYNLCIDNSKKEINALIYGIYNVALEIVCTKFRCVGINGVNGAIILLINVDREKGDVYDELAECFKQISEIIFNSLDISVSSYIGNSLSDSLSIGDEIAKLMKIRVYRYNYTSRCCILPHMIEKNITNPGQNISKKLLDRLTGDILNRNPDDITEVISQIADEIRTMDYYFELPQLLYIAKETESLFGKLSTKSLFNMKGLSGELAECEYLTDAVKCLESRIKKSVTEIIIEDRAKTKSTVKNTADLARDIIENEYSDVNLCNDYIAEKLDVPPRKLSNGFKEVYNISVSEYINNLRLEKSIEILKEKKVSVKDVVSMVGFGSEAYFYRVFKKRYGITPIKYIELYRD